MCISTFKVGKHVVYQLGRIFSGGGGLSRCTGASGVKRRLYTTPFKVMKYITVTYTVNNYGLDYTLNTLTSLYRRLNLSNVSILTICSRDSHVLSLPSHLIRNSILPLSSFIKLVIFFTSHFSLPVLYTIKGARPHLIGVFIQPHPLPQLRILDTVMLTCLTLKNCQPGRR